MRRSANIFKIVICASFLASCGKKTALPKVQTDQNLGQPSGDANSLQDPNGVGDETDLSQATSGALIDAGYALNVKSLLGIKVCEGEVNFQFNPMFAKDGKMFELPSSPISCLFGLKKFDLSELMGSMGGATPPDDGTKPIDLKEDVIGIKKLGFAKFEPSRPMFPSFLATELDDLKRIHVVRKVTTVNGETGVSGSGFASLKVTGYERSYTPPNMDFQFRDVITFEVINTGFEGVDKLKSFIFEKMEMKVSLNPIAVPYIFLQGRVSDFSGAIAGGDSGSATGGILSGFLGDGASGTSTSGIGSVVGGIVKSAKVEMELNMTRMEGLDALEELDDEDEDRDDEDKDSEDGDDEP